LQETSVAGRRPTRLDHRGTWVDEDSNLSLVPPRHGSSAAGQSTRKWLYVYSSVGARTTATARSRPRVVVLRLSAQSRMPHRSMQVADPSGPVAVDTMSTACTCLDGHPIALSDAVGTSSDEHSVGFASRVRRRRDLNPNLSRDRAVCCRVTPRRHVTAIAPGRIELPTSGSKVPRPSPTETPGLHSAAAICAFVCS
jgi:hypothetical protein